MDIEHNIANIAASSSDVLKISGTMLENENGRNIELHQMEWENKNDVLVRNISVYIIDPPTKS